MWSSWKGGKKRVQGEGEMYCSALVESGFLRALFFWFSINPSSEFDALTYGFLLFFFIIFFTWIPFCILLAQNLLAHFNVNITWVLHEFLHILYDAPMDSSHEDKLIWNPSKKGIF